ncbi:MAG: ATP-binding protein [Acidobacteriota bacterium]|nr:ATP-binding protein [Acidobacteriota bacterium]
MAPPRFSLLTLSCVGVVLFSGLATGGDMLRGISDPGPSDLLDLAVFGGLGVFWTLLTFHSGPKRGGRAAIALAPAAYLSMLALAQPAVTATTAVVVLILDWLVHRRHVVAGTFNLGQTLVALWCAHQICAETTRLLPGLPGVALGTLVGGLSYSVVNMSLLQVILRVASGRKAKETGIVGYSALTNEVVVSCFAALMALCWLEFAPLLVLPVLPQTLLFLILSRLEQREGSLRMRQLELQSLQELGLQVSAQLDAARLGPVVARIVAEDMRATRALLGLLTEDQLRFEIVADSVVDRRAPPLSVMERSGFTDEFLAEKRPMIMTPETIPDFADLAALGARQFVAHPLSILGRPEGIVVAYDDGDRETFTKVDAARLSSLTRFIEVSWTNARLYDDVKSMQQQLVQNEKMSALGQLVSGVAHELNNPLAAIMGTTELIGERGLPQPQRSMLDRIHKEADRAARIVRDLLTFSRHQKPTLGWGSVNEVILEVMEVRQPDCRERGIALLTELDTTLTPIKMDPYQIHQVLLNLVTNAMHALESSEDGGTIVVRSVRDRRRVRIEVDDDGHGINESKLDKIFNPFFTTKPVGKGTGLGLSICYGIVQQHGGTIRVRSAPGEGATFMIELPIPAEPPPLELPDQAAPVKPAASRQMTGRVLVVDDEDGIRSVLAEALATWGFEVEQASSGEEGLAAIRKRHFRLAILDLRMPGLDGRELYERVRSEGSRLPPVVFSTGDAASPDARAFLEATKAPVLLKPFTLISLRETIEELLERESVAETV